MGTHPIFESDFDCLTEKKKWVDHDRNHARAGQRSKRRRNQRNRKNVMNPRKAWSKRKNQRRIRNQRKRRRNKKAQVRSHHPRNQLVKSQARRSLRKKNLPNP